MMGRRTFLKAAASAFAAACASSPRTRQSAPRAKKSLLILGGTGFIGPHIVEAARARGHTLTLFNRGKTNPGLFPDIEKLRGDRDGHLEALRGRKWDAVVDDSGYVPRMVRDSAQLLAPNVGHYVFISTISVYREEGAPEGMDESGPLAQLPPGLENTDKVTPETYGPFKSLCEKEVAAALPGRATAIRPGLIVGPRDRSDRFTYWPVRLDRGGEVLAPGDGSDPMQLIDARDLAAWIVLVVEQRLAGTFNAVGPATRTPMRALIDACRQATATPSTITWVPADFLEQQKVSPWSDMPVWIPFAEGHKGMTTVSSARATQHGLTFRPLADTARDTLAWWKTLPAERRAKPRAGISAEREREVLAAWHAKK